MSFKLTLNSFTCVSDECEGIQTLKSIFCKKKLPCMSLANETCFAQKCLDMNKIAVVHEDCDMFHGFDFCHLQKKTPKPHQNRTWKNFTSK